MEYIPRQRSPHRVCFPLRLDHGDGASTGFRGRSSWSLDAKTRVWECKDGPTGSPLAPPLASAARFILRSRDPVERLLRDGVLSEKEAQLGRMFLHVAHVVQL